MQNYQQPLGQPYAPQQKPMPNTYMVWAIVTTILCCIPTGIVSIVYAGKVSKLYSEGQYDAAVKASNSAKVWAIVSVFVGIIADIIAFAGGAFSALLQNGGGY